MTDLPACDLKPGQQLEGFRVKTVTPLPSQRLVVCELEHAACGARVLHLVTDDDENLFSISFPTPPPDDTGLPHILEHAVLSGSEKFPVRDPFFEMLKMSMATFINAMTGWDRTYYPVSSKVAQDLFNLADVYFDAVFHPLLTPETFQREGHHLAPASADEPAAGLTINGIVYNEMKAAFSNPEQRLTRAGMRGLFPDTAYGRESGGDPDAIPDLTYEDFRAFHRRYYHPGNAYFILYGDIPTSDYLAFLAPRLAPYERQDFAPEFTFQPRWAEPRSMRDDYPVDEDDLTGKTFLMMGWVTGDGRDSAHCVAMQVLSHALLGNDAAPLKKALIDSKLGQDLLPSGFGSLGLETSFRVGIKGSEEDRADALRDLVLETLRKLADEGIEDELIRAAFSQEAYRCREITRMQPLTTMSRAMSAWIYGSDPTEFLRADDRLDECRRAYEADPGLFNRMLRERILDNAHRLDVALAPDRGWEARKESEFKARMAAVAEGMSEEHMRELAERDARLQAESGRPNSPEALATLPQLARGDLPDAPTHIPTEVATLPGGVELLRSDVFANGVNYLHLDFDLRGLPEELWALLPRYSETIGKLGAAGLDYTKMARRIAAGTGGVHAAPRFAPSAVDATAHAWGVRFSLRALDEQIEPALGVLRDLLFEPEPRDRERFREVLVQVLAGLRTGLVQGAHRTAMRHAMSRLTPEAYLSEVTGGLPQLKFVGELNKDFDGRFDAMADRIDQIATTLRSPARLTASFTGSDAAYDATRAALSDWIGAMGPGRTDTTPTGLRDAAGAAREGLAAPIQVAHCALAMPAPHGSAPDSVLLALGMHMLRIDYMIQELRFKGNAYGAFCGYDGSGSLWMGSYADPHIARTLKVFADLPAFVRDVAWTDVEVTRGIISSAKTELAPIRPGDATGLALERHLTGRTREHREERYGLLLGATPDQLKRALLAALEAGMPRATVCVLSNREKLTQANKEMPDAPLDVRDLLR